MSAKILHASAGMEVAFTVCHSHVKTGVSKLALLPLARAVAIAAI